MVQYLTALNRCRRCYVRLVQPVVAPPEPRAPAQPNVAAGVRGWRLIRGLTQKQLAVGARLPRTYISRIENGRIIPGLVTLERVAEALAVSLPVLLIPSLTEGILSGNGNGNGAASGNGNGMGAASPTPTAAGGRLPASSPETDACLREILRYSGILTCAQRLQVLVRVRELASAHLSLAH